MASDRSHRFSKRPQLGLRLVAGLGVEGDAHAGATVRHRSRVARDPSQPNLRQVHLIHAELLDELGAAGFAIAPGELGENVTTRGIDLLALPAGTRLRLGPDAIVEVTGLRNPCIQIERHKEGLLDQVLVHRPGEGIQRKTGVMSVVVAGGEITAGDEILVEYPPEPHRRLEVV